MRSRTTNWGSHFWCISLLLGVLGVGVTLHAQELQFKIKVLDGRNGHPVAKSCVVVQVWENPREFSAEQVATGDQGVVEIRLEQ